MDTVLRTRLESVSVVNSLLVELDVVRNFFFYTKSTRGRRVIIRSEYVFKSSGPLRELFFNLQIKPSVSHLKLPPKTCPYAR